MKDIRLNLMVVLSVDIRNILHAKVGKANYDMDNKLDKLLWNKLKDPASGFDSVEIYTQLRTNTRL